MVDATVSASRPQTIAVWVLRILVALLFLATGFSKLSGQPMMVQEFDTIGLGQWFRYLTGGLEVIGAVVVVIPAVSAFGGLLLLCVTVGAFVTQVSVLHQDWIHTVVIAAVVGATVWLQRVQILSRIGR